MHKKELMIRLCEVEMKLDCYDDIIDDLLKRIKKLEKPAKKATKK